MANWYVNINISYDGGIHTGSYTDPFTFAEWNAGGFSSDSDTFYIYGYRALTTTLSNYTASPNSMVPTGTVVQGWDGSTPTGVAPWIIETNTSFDHVYAWNTTYNHLVTNDYVVSGIEMIFNACYFVNNGSGGVNMLFYSTSPTDFQALTFNGCTIKTGAGGTLDFGGDNMDNFAYWLGSQQRHTLNYCVIEATNISSSDVTITMNDCRVTTPIGNVYTSVTKNPTFSGPVTYFNSFTNVTYSTVLGATLPNVLATDITKANMEFTQYGLPTEPSTPAYGLWGVTRTGIGGFYFGSLLTADFSGTPLSGDADLTVTFTDASTGAIGWDWDFGDGNTSTDQNPVHIYTLAGTHTVLLTVTDGVNYDTKIVTDYVTVNMVADFTSNKTSTVTGDAIAFSDLTLGDPDTWQWSFDDGFYSSDQNPEHAFVLAGQYTITLESSNSEDSDTVIKTQYITIENAVTIILTPDESIPPSEDLLRNMPSTGTGSENLIIKGIRYGIPGSETSPEGSGFKRGNGPSLRFDKGKKC